MCNSEVTCAGRNLIENMHLHFWSQKILLSCAFAYARVHVSLVCGSSRPYDQKKQQQGPSNKGSLAASRLNNYFSPIDNRRALIVKLSNATGQTLNLTV